MKNNYITAVLEMLQAGKEPDTVLTGLKRTLESRGHSRLYVSILRGVEKVLSAHSAEGVIVTVVDQAAYEKQKEAISKALNELKADKEPLIVTDETIVGGFLAEANKQRLDKSYKNKLVSLYRNITK